jgi:hypothetical protein
MAVLRWQAHHYPLGLSSQTSSFGQITVLYQGNPVRNLYATVIDVQNPTYRDLTDLELNAVFHDGCAIYAGEAQVEGSEKTLLLAPSYVALLNAYTTMAPTDPKRPDLAKAVATRRDFQVPVFNRGKTLRVVLVVESVSGAQPVVNLSSDHAGVKLIFRGPQVLVLGVERPLAAAVGIAVGAALIVAASAYLFDAASTVSALLFFAVGCFVAALGAGVVRAARWLFRVLG